MTTSNSSPLETTVQPVASTPTTQNVVIAEQLYDTLGRSAFATVAATKGQGAAYGGTLGFEGGFVTPRNPASPPPPPDTTDFWKGGGPMEGLVDSWVDPRVFISTDDQQFAYTGSYYEKDATARVDKTSGPGTLFNAASTHTLKYGYGQYLTLEDGNLNTPPGITTALQDVIPTRNIMTSAIQSQKFYTTSVSRVPLGNQQASLYQVKISEWNGDAGTSLSFQPSGQYLLSHSEYVNQPLNNAGIPSVRQKTAYQPNAYDHTGNILAPLKANFSGMASIDAQGRVVQSTTPDTSMTNVYYNYNGLLEFSQDADQAAGKSCLWFFYDELKRLVEIRIASLNAWSLSSLLALDPHDNSISLLLRRFEYDVYTLSTSSLTNTQGRLVQVESWNSHSDFKSIDPTLYANSYVREVYFYDALGRLQNTQTFFAGSTTPNYYIYNTYNNLNQLTSYNVNALSGGVYFNYNMQGQVKDLGAGDFVNSYAAYTYNEDSTINTETLNFPSPTITRSYAYNTLKQLTSITDDQGAFTEQLSYTFTPGGTDYQDGNIQIAHSAFGAHPGALFTYNYTYDAFSRLIKASSNEPYMPSWEIAKASCPKIAGGYDSNGNIWSSQTTLQGTPTSSCNTYNEGTNQIASNSATGQSYTYTPAGRLKMITNVSANTHSQDWLYDTLLGTLLSVTQVQANGTQTTSQFVYDARGERVSKKVTRNPSTSPTYLLSIQYWRRGTQVIHENVTYNPDNSYGINYVYGPTGLIVMGIEATGGGANPSYDARYTLLKDHLGSVRAVYSDRTGPLLDIPLFFNYGAWGDIVTGNSSLGAGGDTDAHLASLFRYLYTGQEYDPHFSLYNYHARIYDQVLGRFLTPDPKYQTPSPYVYCADNPINLVDPNGKDFNGFMDWLENTFGLDSLFTRGTRRIARFFGAERLWNRWIDWRLERLGRRFGTDQFLFNVDLGEFEQFNNFPIAEANPHWDRNPDRVAAKAVREAEFAAQMEEARVRDVQEHRSIYRRRVKAVMEAHPAFDRDPGGGVGIWNRNSGVMHIGFYSANRPIAFADAGQLTEEEEFAFTISHGQQARTHYGLQPPFFQGVRNAGLDELRPTYPELRGFTLMHTGEQQAELGFTSQSLNGYRGIGQGDGTAFLHERPVRMGIALELRNRGMRISFPTRQFPNYSSAELAASHLFRL